MTYNFDNQGAQKEPQTCALRNHKLLGGTKTVRIILVVLCWFLLAPPTPSDEKTGGNLREKPRIAVLDFRGLGNVEKDLGVAVSEILRAEFTKTDKYIVVERSALQKVIEELKLPKTGLIDEKTAAEVGKLVGANLILIGSISKIGETYTISSRFVDVETGQSDKGENAMCKGEDTISESCVSLAHALIDTGKDDEHFVTPSKGTRSQTSGKVLTGTKEFSNCTVGGRSIDQYILKIKPKGTAFRNEEDAERCRAKKFIITVKNQGKDVWFLTKNTICVKISAKPTSEDVHEVATINENSEREIVLDISATKCGDSTTITVSIVNGNGPNKPGNLIATNYSLTITAIYSIPQELDERKDVLDSTSLVDAHRL